jgi:hypothetical protein
MEKKSSKNYCKNRCLDDKEDEETALYACGKKAVEGQCSSCKNGTTNRQIAETKLVKKLVDEVEA